MKRETAFQPFSHQHRNALMGCELIKKGIGKKADKKVLKDFASKLWRDDIKTHMQAEEKYILPLLKGNPLHYDAIILRDHETIGLMAERILVSDNGYSAYAAFADLLEQHIRFEEHVVFEKVQEKMNEHDLVQIENSLRSVKPGKCTDYPDKFWE